MGDEFDEEHEVLTSGWGVGDDNDEERNTCTHVRRLMTMIKNSKYSQWVGDDNDDEHEIFTTGW